MKKLKRKNYKKFGDRYAPNWPEISTLAKRLTKGKCVLCDRKAVFTHHAVYFDKKIGILAGHEIPGIHVFPLCSYHHSKKNTDCAHHPDNWIWDNSAPKIKNRNTPEYYLLLRNGWKAATGKTPSTKKALITEFKLKNSLLTKRSHSP